MAALVLSNRISLDIAPEDWTAIQDAVKTLQAKLLVHLVDLDGEDRKALPKMGAKTVDFVTKTIAHTRANLQYQPQFVDLDEMDRDLAAVNLLRGLLAPLKQLADMVDDSLMLSGSEAYAAALACYHSFKSAARLNMPGAAVVADDLSTRFPGGRALKAPTPAPIPAPVPAPASDKA